MTEISRPWSGIVTGDAGPYTDDNWMDVWDSLMTLVTPTPNDFGGVFKDQLSELAPISAGVSPLTIGTGRAIVNGSWYESDAAETIAIATPGANPRIDRIVLRKDWALQTIRLTRIAGVEGASPAVPALVQTDGVTWDVPIAQVRIPVGGSFDYIRDERLLIGQYQPVGIQDQQTYFDDEFFDGGDWVDLESRRMWQAAISAGAGNLLRVLNAAGIGSGALRFEHGVGTGDSVTLTSQNHRPDQINAHLTIRCKEPNSDANLDRTMGFVSTANSLTPTDGIFLRADGAANWFAVCRAGGVETAVDTGQALTNTFKKFEIQIYREAPTAVAVFKIDDVDVAVIFANIPNDVAMNLNACSIFDNGGAPASAEYQHLDAVKLQGGR